MKKTINFIKAGLIRIIIFLFILSLAFVTLTYVFSLKNNMSFENALLYFQTIGSEIIASFKPSNNNYTNANTTIGNSATIIDIDNYYYRQLDTNGKIIYNSLESNIDNLKKENYTIDFSTTFNDLLNETTGQYKLNRSFQSALDAFYYDHPELFYINLSKFNLNTKCISIAGIKTYTVQIVPQDNKNYLHSSFKSEQEVNNAIVKVENAKDNIINSVSNEADLYNKIKKIHDILVTSIEYDTTFNKQNAHNIYGALIEKEVVCEGYAKTFKYILNSLDIECILVSGVATNSSGNAESHMWNYVKLNNYWYGVDVTWDDPIIIGGNENQTIRHDYLLKRNSTFSYTHIPNGKISDEGMLFSLPALSSNNYKW